MWQPLTGIQSVLLTEEVLIIHKLRHLVQICKAEEMIRHERQRRIADPLAGVVFYPYGHGSSVSLLERFATVEDDVHPAGAFLERIGICSRAP